MRVIVENTTRVRIPPLSLRTLGVTAKRLLRLPGGSEITLVFVSDAAMRALNRRVRGHDRSTDVLSFPLHVRRPFAADADGIVRFGDVIVSLPTARRQARKRHALFRDELRELVVHGLLHCVGFSHDRPRGSSRMRRMAEALLTFRAPPAS